MKTCDDDNRNAFSFHRNYGDFNQTTKKNNNVKKFVQINCLINGRSSKKKLDIDRTRIPQRAYIFRN